MPKHAIRKRILAQRHGLDQERWQHSSRSAQLNLLGLAEYAGASCVALYMAVRGEVDTSLILRRCRDDGKRVLLPAVCGSEMVFRLLDAGEELRPGCYGIPEPCPTGPDHDASTADLIVVPGVAFDRAGHRIGHGRGYYDRFLDHRGRKGHLVGFCHDFQLLDEPIPVEGHDIRMELIVTDRRVIRCAGEQT